MSFNNGARKTSRGMENTPMWIRVWAPTFIKLQKLPTTFHIYRLTSLDVSFDNVWDGECVEFIYLTRIALQIY